jgi:hypothetical protein
MQHIYIYIHQLAVEVLLKVVATSDALYYRLYIIYIYIYIYI